MTGLPAPLVLVQAVPRVLAAQETYCGAGASAPGGPMLRSAPIATRSRILSMILGALAVMAAGPVTALSARDCARVTQVPAEGELVLPGQDSFRDVHGPAVDLGGGWVLQQYEISGGAGIQFGAKVKQCASGTGIIVVEAVERSGVPVERIARISAEEAFRAAIAAPEVVSLDAVIARLSAGGANVGVDALSAPDLETCGCAVFYPEMRGAKTPWRAE